SNRHFGEGFETISGQRNVQKRLKTRVASRLSLRADTSCFPVSAHQEPYPSVRRQRLLSRSLWSAGNPLVWAGSRSPSPYPLRVIFRSPLGTARCGETKALACQRDKEGQWYDHHRRQPRS